MTLQHINVLVPSQPDTIALADAVESRFLDLCAAHRRIRGTDLLIPGSLDGDFYKWRELRVRHRKGDFRSTEAELRSTKTIAQWTLDVNSDLRGQEKQTLKWKD